MFTNTWRQSFALDSFRCIGKIIQVHHITRQWRSHGLESGVHMIRTLKKFGVISLPLFGVNWLCILKNGRWTMTSSFSPKIHTMSQVLVKACECSWQLYFRLFHFILYTWYFTENHIEVMVTIYFEWKS